MVHSPLLSKTLCYSKVCQLLLRFAIQNNAPGDKRSKSPLHYIISPPYHIITFPHMHTLSSFYYLPLGTKGNHTTLLYPTLPSHYPTLPHHIIIFPTISPPFLSYTRFHFTPYPQQALGNYLSNPISHTLSRTPSHIHLPLCALPTPSHTPSHRHSLPFPPPPLSSTGLGNLPL